MYKCVNGEIVEMTEEEDYKYRMWASEQAQTPPTPTDAERIAQLEEELKATKILLGLEE